MTKTESYYAIVPVYNEQKNIRLFIKKLKKYCKNIIVVNDGSTDKTKEILKNISEIKVINLKKNRGKGVAMKSGAELAWKLKAKGIIFMDGDHQHNPKHLQSFIKPLKDCKDIIIGIRTIKDNIPLIRRLGNETFMFLMKMLFGVEIPDILCGFRAFSKKGYKQILWKSSGYGVETEMITLVGRKKLPFETVVVDTIYLDKYKGFSVYGGIKILLRLPYWRLRRIVK